METGGYFELEDFSGREYYAGATALNLGRNCIRVLINKKNIRRIYLPVYLCGSLTEAVKRTGTEIVCYDINEDFTPCLQSPVEENSWVYIVNYYGQLDNLKLEELRIKYGRIIVDNAQCFFQKPIDGVDTIYSCRKFFGVSDGAYLISDVFCDDLEVDKSYNRMSAVLGRYEKSAQEFYHQFRQIENGMSEWEIMKMSKITRNILSAVDYDRVRQKREHNYRVVEEQLADLNGLRFNMPPGPFVYPLYIERAVTIHSRF